MPKPWRIQPHDPQSIQHLERAAAIPAVVAQLLICRGIRDERTAREFLEPKLSGLRDPETLPGIPLAADRIMAALQAGRPIVVYGDYDADGMTATAILVDCLRLLGGSVTSYIPNRLEEGYGLSDEALRQLAARGASLVVTVDCGVASVAEAQTARQLGLELIITDHHGFAAQLPDAAAIVHPQLPGHEYPFAGLSGAGVAFKLAWALCQRASQAKRVSARMRDFLMQAVGLAAIGTTADVVPLLDENRILVRHGLVALKERPSLGIEALSRLNKLHEKPMLACEDIGFCLAPRLNAAGRLGQAQLGVELLTTTNPERAQALAEYLHELNSSRDSLERSIYLAANKMVQEQFDPAEHSALVLAGRGWHAGVIGIVANRLVEKYHRPVVLIALDEVGVKPGVGSVRSIKGFDVHAALTACTHHLISHGGHAAAAGLRVEERSIDAFREEFCELASAEIPSDQRAAELLIDGEVALGALTPAIIEQIEMLAPFGHGNARPLLCASHVTLSEPPKRMGGGGRHLTFRVRQNGANLRAVAFGNGDWCEELAGATGPLRLAFRPVLNEYKGRRSVEMQVADWQPAASP